MPFSVGEGVTVLRCDYSQPEKWTRLAFGASQDMPAGVDIRFGIAVDKEELTVSVAGKEVARAALGGRSPIGPWGLGAQAGSTGEWKDITVKAGR